MVRSIDYDHSYETNEYCKDGYFTRLGKAYGDEIIVADSAQYGAKIFSSIYDKVFDDDLQMEVVRFYNYNSNISYKLETVNQNRKSYFCLFSQGSEDGKNHSCRRQKSNQLQSGQPQGYLPYS